MPNLILDAAKKLDIENFPVEIQEEILAKAGELVFRASLARALPYLSENERENIEKFLEEKTGDELELVSRVVANKVPEFKNFIAEETEDFVKDSRAAIAAMRAAKK